MDYFSADADARIDGALIVLRALILLNLVAAALFAQAYPALADGGILQMQRSSGPFVITVFTAPAPLRAGPADISIMVQASNNDPVLDAQVTVIIQRENREAIKAEARRGQSKNRLLYTALLSLPESGRWEIEVAVVRNAEETRISGVMMVAPPQSYLITYWRTMAIPPVTIGLFVINQWLRGRIHHKSTKREHKKHKLPLCVLCFYFVPFVVNFRF